MFYTKFISNGFSLLKSNGILSYINPYSWIDKGLFNDMKSNGYFHTINQKDGDEIFGISMGSALCTFIYEKDHITKGSANIEIHPKFKKDLFARNIISKMSKLQHE